METTTSEPLKAVHWSSHCKNGGTGFFGSFCHCPPDYEGRFCEIKKDQHANCGLIHHGIWVKDDCKTCYCIEGVIKCTDNHPVKCPTKYGMDLDELLRLQIEDLTKDTAREPINTSSSIGLISSYLLISINLLCFVII